MPRTRSSSRNSPNSIINISSPITTPDDFYNLATPPSDIHPNVTIRAPRRPRRRSLTMDDEEIYNTLLELDSDMNNSFSLIDDTETSFNTIQDDDRYGINASVPLSYKRKEKYNIDTLSNKTLDTHKGKIKIKTTQTIYDPIMMEDTNIQDYIKEDVDNVVFLYEKKYFLSTKSTLKEFINMTTTDNAIVFDCRGIGYVNVNHEYPYVLINKIGIILNDFTNVISLENAIAITKAESGQYFFIKGTEEVLISTVTDNVLNGKYPNALGASHCQGGKSAIVYDIQTFKPEYKTHSKTSKTHKKHNSKSPKSSKSPKKRTIKKHVKRMLK